MSTSALEETLKYNKILSAFKIDSQIQYQFSLLISVLSLLYINNSIVANVNWIRISNRRTKAVVTVPAIS
jgi:hypothetical protein